MQIPTHEEYFYFYTIDIANHSGGTKTSKAFRIASVEDLEVTIDTIKSYLEEDAFILFQQQREQLD